ncbi:MAG: DUF2130 domain-containing protein, partial [Bacteroidia bacterium]
MTDNIKCPNCSEVFKVDESGFASILKQVRDREFDKEISDRLRLAETEKETAVKLAEANLRNKMQQHLSNKDKEINEEKARKEQDYANQLAAKELELAELKSKIKNAEIEKTHNPKKEFGSEEFRDTDSLSTGDSKIETKDSPANSNA